MKYKIGNPEPSCDLGIRFCGLQILRGGIGGGRGGIVSSSELKLGSGE